MKSDRQTKWLVFRDPKTHRRLWFAGISQNPGNHIRWAEREHRACQFSSEQKARGIMSWLLGCGTDVRGGLFLKEVKE